MQQQNDLAKGRNRNILGAIIGVNAILIIAYFITSAIDTQNQAFGPTTMSMNVFSIAFMTFVFSVGIVIYVYFTRCPSCHALWARKEDPEKKEELSRKKGYRTRTESQDIKNSSGDVVGKTERSYQVRVQVLQHRHYYHCIVCNHVWTEDKQTTRDNFDDD